MLSISASLQLPPVPMPAPSHKRRVIALAIACSLATLAGSAPRATFADETATRPHDAGTRSCRLSADPGWMLPQQTNGEGRVSRSQVFMLNGVLTDDIALGGVNEPTIVVDPNDPQHLAVADLLQLRVSTDGGATWQPPVRSKPPENLLPFGDSSIAFDSQARLFWTYLTYTIDVETPPDDRFEFGIAISQCDPVTGEILPGYPVEVTTDTPPVGADKEWLAIDSFDGSPFVDRLYLAWIYFGETNTSVRTTHSTDQGMTWSPVIEMATDVWPVHNAVAPNGDVYVAYQVQPGYISGVPDGISGQVVVSRSTDGGESYGPPVLAFQPGEADITYNVQHAAWGTIPGTQFWTQGSAQPWILCDPNTPGRLYVVACDDPDNTHGVDDEANVYMVTSTDHGATWNAPARVDDGPGTTFQLFPTAAIDRQSGDIAVTYYDNRNGNTNADGNFLLDVFATLSTDGGNTFTKGVQINDLPFDPDAAAPCRLSCGGRHLFRVWGTSASDVFAVGRHTILHYDGLDWSIELDTGEFLWGVGGTAPNDVFAVGEEGVIRHYNGVSWSVQASGTSELLYGVWGAASDDVFAVGVGGTILHYDGTSWSPQASGTTMALTDVWGAAADDVFAAGDTGTVLHYDGVSWSPMTSGTNEILWDVWGSAADDVFAVGLGGGILHYDGSAWSLDASRAGHVLAGLWGSSGTDVFAVDYRGAILHYDGTVWSEMSPATPYLRGAWGSSGSDVFVVGREGWIFHYDGIAWAPQDNPARPPDDATFRIGEYNGVAVAEGLAHAVWSGNETNPNGVAVAQQIFFDGHGVTTVPDVSSPTSPVALSVRPNPMSFGAEFVIADALPAGQIVEIYDPQGRLVDVLRSGGQGTVTWRPGESAANGVYLSRLRGRGSAGTVKFLLVR